jgi:signal transduction histidine kinase
MYLLFRFDFGKRFNALMSIARDLAIDKQPSIRVTGKDELAELSTALLRASDARLEAVAEKQMLYQMVTHDLRSPLMAASIVVDALLRELASLNAEVVDRLHSLERSLKTVVGLTNDLLTVEKLSAGGLEITRVKADFRDTIAQAIEMVTPLADCKSCRINNQSPSLLVLIDEDRILQVTVNLLSNAIKFSPQSGEVDVTAAVQDNWLRVEILDRGPGIEEKDSQRLFNPFQQGARAYKAGGFGLGLTIARLLVELHGGNIGAMPRPGGGSIFWYTLRLSGS